MNRILVVDDDIASCRTMTLYLGGEGHEVRVPTRFEDGLAAVRAAAPQLLIGGLNELDAAVAKANPSGLS